MHNGNGNSIKTFIYLYVVSGGWYIPKNITSDVLRWGGSEEINLSRKFSSIVALMGRWINFWLSYFVKQTIISVIVAIPHALNLTFPFDLQLTFKDFICTYIAVNPIRNTILSKASIHYTKPFDFVLNRFNEWYICK